MTTAKAKLALLAFASLVAGIAEAALLALLATAASALSVGDSRVEIAFGAVQLGAEVSTILAIGVGLAVLRGLLAVLMAYLPARMSVEVMTGARRRLFDAFLSAAWSTKATQRDGYFQSLMTLHVTTAARAVVVLGTGISAVIMFASLLGSAFVLSAETAFALILLSGGLFLGLRPLARYLRRQATALSNESVEYSKVVQEVVLMAEETEVFGASDDYREAFYKSIDQVRHPMLRTRFASKAIPGIYQSVAFLVLVAALFGVSVLGVEPSQLATLGAVLLILLRSMAYGQQIQTALSQLDEAMPFMIKIAEAVEEYDAQPHTGGDRDLPAIDTISMRAVRFQYPGGPQVLSGLDFSVTKGEAIGVAGPSGAGKSSVVQILLRLRDPSSGVLLINGEDASEFRRDQWQSRVAYVPQTSQVIWGTVAENIRFYRPGITQEDIETAARKASIHDEIVSWERGYDTIIGQRAAAVSGGQRQRLCIARALAGAPDVLILDEATSALDIKSEALVQETLNKLKEEVTMFVVGHRLSTLTFCDRIMVIREGRIDGFDTPAAMLRANAFYREADAISRGET